MIVAGVDPGKHEHGVAVVIDGRLTLAARGRAGVVGVLARSAGVLAIEMPTRVFKGPPEDLIAVARGGQRVICEYERRQARPDGRVVELAPDGPKAWKSPIKKWTHHMRIWAKLSEPERKVFASAFNKSTQQIWNYIDKACCTAAIKKDAPYSANFTHALDAVGIALYQAGVIARTGLRLK